jgi:hypothetical protein
MFQNGYKDFSYIEEDNIKKKSKNYASNVV